MSQVLEGIRVIDQGTFITGSYTAMLLGDLGADVIKIESPEGDPYRSYESGSYSPHFQAYNRNKRSLALDLKLEEDRLLFEKLVKEADVYVQNFRPGAAERLGAGEGMLRELNNRLVYCSISGFGASGPYRDRPSYDSVAQALSGFLSVVLDRERPRFMGPALADAVTGIYAAYGVLGALVERGRTGRGRLVEVSMLEAMAHFAIEPFTAFFELGRAPVSQDRPRLAQAHILRAADGPLLVIHLSSVEKFWKSLLAALEAPHLAADPRFSTRQARIQNYEALGAELGKLFATRPADQWAERLSTRDVPFAALAGIDAVVRDPQVRHLDLVVPLADGIGRRRTLRPAIRYDGSCTTEVRAAPRLDEHGEQIRATVANCGGWPAKESLCNT